jgi:DNA-binding IclR family transcriptional regulator
MAGKVTLFRTTREMSRPFLRELSESCQETVTFTVLDVDKVVNLERYVPPTRRITNYGEVGLKAPPHCAAAGKVLLAYLPEAEADRFLSGALERFTVHTITDPEELRNVLALVRQQGYATAREELEEGLNVVAAPVYERDGQVRAAVCIAGPASRVSPERFPEFAEQLIVIAERISRQVGYLGESAPSG